MTFERDSKKLKANMDMEMNNIMSRHEAGAELFTFMGTYAPAFGMMGTVIGLIVMMYGFDTGGGGAVAEKFAKEGWKVAVSARRKEILDEMSDNENIFSYPLDVTNRDQINNVFTKIIG